LDISNGRLEEVNIDNLPFLQFLRLKSSSVERISLKSLHSLKRLFLYINRLQTSLQADLFEQVPNIEKLTVKSDSFSFDYVMEEKSLLISFKSFNDVDFAPIYPISNEIETLRINDSTISNSRTFLSVSRYFRNVLDLSITNSRIEKIDREMFEELSNLRSLSLQYNRYLRKIDYDAFSNLKELTNLSLAYNSIRSLDKRVFSSLVDLEILNVTENGIKRLNKEIFSNQSNLRQLYLGSSRYKRLDHALFVGLEYLYHLHLPGCVLTNFDLRILDNLPRLERILLSKLSISHNETEILNRFDEAGIDYQFYT
jgi:insulin-like growth factor-binding protein complex acid labile subunit